MEISKDKINKDLKAVASIKSKNEKLSWTRRQKNLEELIKNVVNPLAQNIMELQKKHQEYIDEIIQIRKQMAKECIHPKDHLIHMGTHIVCKFCDAKLSLPRIK